MARRDMIDTEATTPAQAVRTFLITLCIGFTVVMVVCMALGIVFADEQSKQGIMYCWSIFGACAVAAFLQFVFFTPVLIKRMAYSLRLLIFGVCLYAVLAVLAVVMHWFPANMAGAWVSFTLIYLIALVAVTVIIEFSRRRETKTLNEKLSAYRNGGN